MILSIQEAEVSWKKAKLIVYCMYINFIMILIGAIDAIRTISSIDSPLNNFTIRQKENRTAKTLIALSAFYSEMLKEVLAGKNGIFRKHIFGTRTHFSIRAVISSITVKNDYDEVHAPWGASVTALKMHLLNKLFKLDYTPNQAIGFLQEHTAKYHPLIARLFKELIDESPDKGLWAIFQRNPSLTKASAQRVKVTKFKDDPDDPTIGLPIPSTKGYNADFDGKLIVVIKLF